MRPFSVIASDAGAGKEELIDALGRAFDPADKVAVLIVELIHQFCGVSMLKTSCIDYEMAARERRGRGTHLLTSGYHL